MSKWKRRFVWMAAFGLAGIVYLCFFGAQTYFALLTRYTGRKVPIVNSIPVSLEDLSVSEVRGNRLSFQGAEFEVPWDDLDEQNTRITGKWALFHFLSGRSIVLCVGSPSIFIDGLAKDKTIDLKLFAVLFGKDVLQSDYTLYNAIYKTSPSQITLSTTANRAAGLTGVILIKAIMPPTTDSAIYKVSSKDVKGFQLGNPARRPKRMCLELFTDDAEFGER